jgi:chromosome segregation ATPase
MTPHYTQKRNKDGTAYRIPYYRCTRTMHFSNSVCPVKHINADHVEGLVVGKLSELSQNENYLKSSIQELNGNLQRKAEPLEREARQLRKRLGEIEQEIGRYVKALGQGKLSIGRLEAQIGRLETDKKTLQAELRECERKINESAVRDYSSELLQRTLQDFRTVFTSLTPAEQLFELEEFQPSSHKREVWLPGLDSN